MVRNPIGFIVRRRSLKKQKPVSECGALYPYYSKM